MTHQNRCLELVRLILHHKVFHDAFGLYLKNNKLPNKKAIVTLIQSVDGISGDTLNRRTSTVLSWLGWILELPTR